MAVHKNTAISTRCSEIVPKTVQDSSEFNNPCYHTGLPLISVVVKSVAGFPCFMARVIRRRATKDERRSFAKRRKLFLQINHPLRRTLQKMLVIKLDVSSWGKGKKRWVVVMKSNRLTGMASVEGPVQCASILEAFFCWWLQQ